MNQDDLRDQQIERYIHRQMSDEERLQFEETMRNDTALQAEVHDQQELISLYDKGLIDFKKKLDRLNSEHSPINKRDADKKAETAKSQTNLRQVIRMKYVLAAAAGIALLISAFWFFNRTPNAEMLAINAVKNDFTYYRSELSPDDSLFAIGDYANFINSALPQIKNSSSQHNLLNLKVDVARAYILSGKPQEALGFIRSFSEEEKKDCKVRYCIAVVELATKETGPAISLLEAISNNKCYPYDDKAADLLKKLK